jgi:hypothetical protein
VSQVGLPSQARDRDDPRMTPRPPLAVLLAFLAGVVTGPLPSQAKGERPTPLAVDGIYPHLAMFNDHPECGVGAVVPFAGRLWAITYAPHMPKGSTDKLYEIAPDLTRVVREESTGGTPANRLFHRETGQLVIGPYVIDQDRRVRVLPYTEMLGRPTGTARHLTQPDRKVYVATMEEGLYEVDLIDLSIRELYADTQRPGEDRRLSGLPGYHGKGLYSGQGVLVYANNGENSAEARARPDVPSGCLAEWDGESWRVVRRNQFTEVTGPAGIEGSKAPNTDPIWSVGWDHRSLLLMVRQGGAWSTFRMPKGSHSYDGAHGWNTEWPRIRDVGGDDLLMTMHGTFWSFPRTFSPGSTSGIRPRSNYLKVVGDFCRFGDRVVLGCDDTAAHAFLNTRRAKGQIKPPGQSHSNLWFVEPDRLDQLGPALGRGAVFAHEDVESGDVSDPYLFAGYAHRGAHVFHGSDSSAVLELEVDRKGDGTFTPLRRIEAQPGVLTWVGFAADEQGAWVRVRPRTAIEDLSVVFQYAAEDSRGSNASPAFDGLARLGDVGPVQGGLLRMRGERLGTLAVAAVGPGGENTGFHELDADLRLIARDDPTAWQWTTDAVPIPTEALTADAASVLYVDDEGNRWRLPRGDARFDRPGPLGPGRTLREVVTERDLMLAHGTFYEVPARNAGGFQKVRPVASHDLRIHDFASYRGLLVMTGTRADAAPSARIRRSADASVWCGSLDELWELGKPRGEGGPWLSTPVQADVPSDPYLMTGYDQKSVTLSHDAANTVRCTLEVDALGDGSFRPWHRVDVPAGEAVDYTFPDGFHAYWVRVVPDQDCVATARFDYR